MAHRKTARILYGVKTFYKSFCKTILITISFFEKRPTISVLVIRQHLQKLQLKTIRRRYACSVCTPNASSVIFKNFKKMRFPRQHRYHTIYRRRYYYNHRYTEKTTFSRRTLIIIIIILNTVQRLRVYYIVGTTRHTVYYYNAIIIHEYTTRLVENIMYMRRRRHTVTIRATAAAAANRSTPSRPRNI